MNLISIIIPTYNRSQIVHRAIKSVLKQSNESWELIIVDDGSKDDTLESLKIYDMDPRIKILSQEHLGPSSARNYGVQSSKGNYLIFLDSDDFLREDLIQSLIDSNYQNFDMISWEVLRIYENKESVWKPEKLEKLYNNIKASFLAGSVCFKKEIFERVKGFDPKLWFGENYELGMRVAQISNLKILNLRGIFLHYYINEEYRSSNQPNLKLDSLKYLHQKHKVFYLQDSYSYSRLLYQIGFLYEKLGCMEVSIKYYSKAKQIRPMYLKPIIKVLLLNLNQRI